MTASEAIEKPQEEFKQPQSAGEQDKRPSGTMFDPETIRKFVEQIKKADK